VDSEARRVYLLKLPGFERKIRVALDWTLDLFFPRDIVYLRPLHLSHGSPPAASHLAPQASDRPGAVAPRGRA
jgi:hypothetical protein